MDNVNCNEDILRLDKSKEVISRWTLPGSRKMIISVSGQNFVSSSKVLSKYPKTRLGKLAAGEESHLSFEGDTEIFREILKFYWSGELHCPKNVCFDNFKTHLDFWGIDTHYISECCSADMQEELELDKQFAYFDKRFCFDEKELQGPDAKLRRIRNKVWCFLTCPTLPDGRRSKLAVAWAIFYLAVTICTGLMYAWDTVKPDHVQALAVVNEGATMAPSNLTECEKAFGDIESANYKYMKISLLLTTSFFALEIWARFLCCPNKRRFVVSAHMFDMTISVIESGTTVWFIILDHLHTTRPERVPAAQLERFCKDTRIMMTFTVMMQQLRMGRLLSYANSYDGLKVLLISLYRSWKEILLLYILLGMSILLFAPCVFFMSWMTRNDSTELPLIDSIPSAYWFVLVTMTTVGYGDMYPVTYGGYASTMLVMICGMMITALPVAIIGSNFTVVYEYNSRRRKRMAKKSKPAAVELSDAMGD